MPLLDVTETAYLFRGCGQRYGNVMIVRRQRVEHLGKRRLIVLDELSLRPAFLRAAERIESSAAQELESRQQAEGGKEPGAETHLPRQTGRAVAPRQKRRRQMKLKAQLFAIERIGDLCQECAVGVKPCDLVFILIRHQLEQ